MNTYDVADEALGAMKAKGVEGEIILCLSESTSVSQRLLKHEETAHSKNCQIGIRVVVDGKRCSCVSFNDFEQVSDSVSAAVAIASSMPEDPYLSVSETSGERNSDWDEMQLRDDSVVETSRISEMLKEMEEVALSSDSRIVNSEGASFYRLDSQVMLATSSGFIGTYKRSRFSTSVSVVAASNGKMEVDYSFSVKNRFCDLKKPEALGKESASRVLRRLDAREIKTCKAPVLFENRVASSFLRNFAAAVCGSAVVDKTSFLVGKIYTKVFNDGVFIVDDPLMTGGLSSRPFDGEGVNSRKNNVVEDGVLQSWLLDMRTAKQLGLQTTGSAVRRSNASVSPAVSNFYMQSTDVSVEELMSDIKEGIYITDIFGSGINLTTGDYSQGAFGFMIEDGKIAYPVRGITVAGNMLDMFASVRAANDLLFLGSVSCPTLRFGDMVVSGT
ncbi:MAG: TldD/PmbA family protein [Anaplasma sp.]